MIKEVIETEVIQLRAKSPLLSIENVVFVKVNACDFKPGDKVDVIVMRAEEEKG